MASYIIDLNDDMISKMRTDSLKKFRQNYDSIIEKVSGNKSNAD